MHSPVERPIALPRIEAASHGLLPGDAHSELAGKTNGRTAPGGLQIAYLRNFHRAGFNQRHQK